MCNYSYTLNINIFNSCKTWEVKLKMLKSVNWKLNYYLYYYYTRLTAFFPG